MLMEEVSRIKRGYLRGDITLDEAKKLVKPLLDNANQMASVIAKRFGRKHRPFTFTQVFR